VETPSASPDSRVRFFPTILSSQRSTPTTPAEETRYRKRLVSTSAVSGGLPLDLKGMTFTLLDPPPDQSDDSNEIDSPSPFQPRFQLPSSMEGVSDETNRPSLTITPPSTPSFNTPSLGSPTLTFPGRGGVKDASGTRRMMLKRKSSSFLRANSSASQTVGENGSRASYIAKGT
jgi:hypothetical protein